MTVLTLQAARELGARMLRAAGVADDTAATVARALAAAEADAIPSHGLSRLPGYADQVLNRKLDGMARPAVTESAAGAVRVDAGNGFAYPAINAGLARGAALARKSGAVGVAIANSNHSGVAGHHVERMAEQGLIAMMFANTPAGIAPWGGSKPLFGTNPIAFACPCAGRAPLVIDLSVARVPRGKIAVAARKGEAIPPDWAFDADGKPTTDSKVALRGTLRAIDDAKGPALALMVELLAAALTGSNFSHEAGSFVSDGPPLRLGQFFMVLDPARFAGDGFADRVAGLAAAIAAQPGARLPGDRRLAARRRAEAAGVTIPDDLHADILRRAGGN